MSEVWRVLLALAIPVLAGGGTYLAIRLVTDLKL
jgi:hypothetical protein